MTTIRKVSAGNYIVANQTHSVSVYRRETNNEWMAAAEWDRFRYSDPVSTKREAVEIAKNMLKTANDF